MLAIDEWYGGRDEDRRVEMVKIWINENYHLEMEMKDGERWLRPVAGNLHENKDFNVIWGDALKPVYVLLEREGKWPYA